MTWWQTLILGIVQGLTEFLPISSSAHLALVPAWLGWQLPEQEAFIFDVLVQVATLVAVVGYHREPLRRMAAALWQDLRQHGAPKRPEARLPLLLLVATVPAGIAGLLWKDAVAQAFQRPQQVAYFLLFTALLLALAEVLGRRVRGMHTLGAGDALFVGLFQALALFPGVSRSGATIAAGMFRHLRRDDAANFAFLMAVPIMLAAGAVALWDLTRLPSEALARLWFPYLVGFTAAALSGYAAIHGLLTFLRGHALWWFALYCAALAGFTLWFF